MLLKYHKILDLDSTSFKFVLFHWYMFNMFCWVIKGLLRSLRKMYLGPLVNKDQGVNPAHTNFW